MRYIVQESGCHRSHRRRSPSYAPSARAIIPLEHFFPINGSGWIVGVDDNNRPGLFIDPGGNILYIGLPVIILIQIVGTRFPGELIYNRAVERIPGRRNKHILTRIDQSGQTDIDRLRGPGGDEYIPDPVYPFTSGRS